MIAEMVKEWKDSEFSHLNGCPSRCFVNYLQLHMKITKEFYSPSTSSPSRSCCVATPCRSPGLLSQHPIAVTFYSGGNGRYSRPVSTIHTSIPYQLLSSPNELVLAQQEKGAMPLLPASVWRRVKIQVGLSPLFC